MRRFIILITLPLVTQIGYSKSFEYETKPTLGSGLQVTDKERSTEEEERWQALVVREQAKHRAFLDCRNNALERLDSFLISHVKQARQDYIDCTAKHPYYKVWSEPESLATYRGGEYDQLEAADRRIAEYERDMKEAKKGLSKIISRTFFGV